jgi:hypothetical protein
VAIYWPRPIEVRTTELGIPSSVAGVAVETVREQWLVEDRWWTPKPLQRAYFEVVLLDGRNLVVFREPADRERRGRWFEQRS